MSVKDLINQKAELQKVLDQMSVPQMRKNLTNSNLRWLLRNLHINNPENPHLVTATWMIKWILKNNH
jgi:hypothetical protein